MGANNSRTTVDDNNIRPVKRQIGKRSSVNFLSRLDSKSVPDQRQDSAQSPPELLSSDDYLADPPTRSASRQILTKPAPALESRSVSVIHHRPTLSGGTTTSTLCAKGPVSSNEVDDTVDDEVGVSYIEESSTEEPSEELPERSPSFIPTKPLAFSLPAPSVLEEENFSKYGFDQVMEDAWKASSTQIKRRTMSGPELFSAARTLQVSSNFTNSGPSTEESPSTNTLKAIAHPLPPVPSPHSTTAPPRAYYPPHSKYGPTEFFKRAFGIHRSHDSPPQQIEDDLRVARLQRKPYPGNLTRDFNIPTEQSPIALATPLQPAQRSCMTGHETWHESSNYISPVECGMCLCAGDCPTDTLVFWTCGSCALRICAECRAVFDQGSGRGSVKALMSRYNDGSRTVEARGQRGKGKGKENAKGHDSDGRRGHRSHG